MSSEWKSATLGETCLKITDGAHNSPASVTDGKPMASVKDLTRFGVNLKSARLISQEDFELLVKQGCKPSLGDVLIAKDGNSALDTVCSVDSELDAVLLSSVAILRPNPELLDSHFLKFYLSSPDVIDYLKANFISGAAIPRVVLRDFKKAEISLPPLGEQKKIASVFQALDDRIALLRETNATLEAIAQALFKSWFVDFDPVHANAGTQAPSLPPEIQALFPATFTDSPQGPIPEGWEWRDLADVTEILNGFAFKSEDYVSKEDGIFVLRTTNFSDSGFAVKLEKDVYLPENFLESHKKYLCQPFDFHLVMVGASVGHTSLLLPHLLPAFRNQNMWCFREKTGFPSKFFIHEVVKANITDALRSTSGSAREFFRKGDFGARKVLVPNNSVLSIFEEHVSLLKGRLAVNSEKIEYLSETRDTLLPRLISGQLRLPEAITD